MPENHTKDPVILKAIRLLREGRLVAFPTETVYGLGADATKVEAVGRIFQAKKRPLDHPLIVHIAAKEQLADFAVDISEDVMKLAQVFWPGPLTLILKKQPTVLDLVTAEQNTIGLRVPNHPIAQALLQGFGGGVAAPSANQFTHVSPTNARAVREELGDSVDLILDGGQCEVGLESTIIDMSSEIPVILRPGMITATMIDAVLNKEIKTVPRAAVKAPGRHHLHYAPLTKTRLIRSDELLDCLHTLKKESLPIAVIAYGHKDPMLEGVQWCLFSEDVHVYAHDLYRTLRSLDQKQFKQIWIESVPQGTAWDAVRDRLQKASSE
ncbi:MAG: threonylcarbamoyl-AMP synthase [Gammaproteobacteria bacterium RIFCSPHIGHO2_12_FULL_38_14]|nr:MAG: threonylcarbamoyl-AMP synthase [Gammaproteobacteria bacterium RIFCSPHIGHO2_12_FULL_38_14]